MNTNVQLFPGEPALVYPMGGQSAFTLQPGPSLEARINEAERQIILDCLARNRQRRKETAAELGISRVTLYNKMKKFGLL